MALVTATSATARTLFAAAALAAGATAAFAGETVVLNATNDFNDAVFDVTVVTDEGGNLVALKAGERGKPHEVKEASLDLLRGEGLVTRTKKGKKTLTVTGDLDPRLGGRLEFEYLRDAMALSNKFHSAYFDIKFEAGEWAFYLVSLPGGALFKSHGEGLDLDPSFDRFDDAWVFNGQKVRKMHLYLNYRKALFGKPFPVGVRRIQVVE